MNLKETPASWQAGLWILTQSLRERFPSDTSVGDICKELGTGRSVAYENSNTTMKLLSSHLSGKDQIKPDPQQARVTHERDFLMEVIQYERSHPCGLDKGVRTQLDSPYKVFIDDCRQRHLLTIERVSDLLRIPIDTLKKFSRYLKDDASDGADDTRELPKEVIELANHFLRSGKGRKSLKVFCDRNPDLLQKLGMNYRQVLFWFRKLGFVSHRGIFIKNSGLDKIMRFSANQVWGSDGKNLVIIINGEIFRWVWQCLVDCKTTVIVGGVVHHEENTANLLEAIAQSKEKTGVTPLAIVLDNRLSENLPGVLEYLKSLGIEVIKTFPGNSKSNGIVEENFNVFDRWVGPVEIKGSTPSEISLSIAQAVVEIFTQMRGHKPRKSLGNKTAKKTMSQSPPASPEEEALVRSKLKELADRFKNGTSDPDCIRTKKGSDPTSHR